MELETRSLGSTFDKIEAREISGIAVPYDRIERGEMFAKNSVVLDPNVLILWQHDKTKPIGKILESRHTPEGFWIRAKISDTALGNDALRLIADEVINSFSVGMDFVKATRDASGNQIVQSANVREISVVTIPFYTGATITDIRSEPDEIEDSEGEPVPDNTDGESASANIMEETNMENISPNVPELAEVRELADHIARVEIQVAEMTRQDETVLDTRSAGEVIRDLVTRAYTGPTTADSITTPVFKDLAKIVDIARPLGSSFGTGVLPATGNSLEFAVIDTNTIQAAAQGAEGSDLAYGELTLTTSSANVATYGGYFSVTRQIIQRSTVPYLDKAFQSQARALGVALDAALRAEYLSVHADQITAGNTVEVAATGATFTDWLAAVTSAAVKGESIGYPVETLLVDETTFVELMSLQGSDGRPVLLVTGAGTNNVGTINPASVSGSLAGVTVRVDYGIAADECAFVNSAALVAYTSAPTPLDEASAINLTESFSLHNYAAFAAEVPGAIIPIVRTV